MTRGGICAVLLILSGCGSPPLLPDMQPGETGRVTRIVDGDALVLDTGQSVRLVSIQAPAMYPQDGPPEVHAGESTRVLEDLALGRRVQLFYPGITRDRYDRALAHVVTTDGKGPKLWLNRAMVVRGAARVSLYPSTAARGQELLLLEAAAREAREGLWARRPYAVRDAADLPLETRGYLLIAATLGDSLPIDPERQYAPSCLHSLEEAELVLAVRRAAASACGFQAGTRVILRGWVADGEIDLSHPWHLEIQAPD